jgi:hypothetical protein
MKLKLEENAVLGQTVDDFLRKVFQVLSNLRK